MKICKKCNKEHNDRRCLDCHRKYNNLWNEINPRILYFKEWRDKNKDRARDSQKEYRHREGISKKYNSGISGTKEYKLMMRQNRRALVKGGGKLGIKTVQLVYEDNIKKYGTLTCYLCELPIEFGKDHLEHRTPLSRGGTNEYKNLEIACQRCNCKKHARTEEEYRLLNK